jgi:PIN domain nuclease of toxin-antitoxin system
LVRRLAPLIYLDTHVVAWIFAGQLDLLPPGVKERIEGHDLLVSPAVEMELQYLYEVKRTAEPAATVLDVLEREIGLKVCSVPFRNVVEVALGQSWTRDPFDRLIVSQAVFRGVPLITRDRMIRTHCPLAFWESGPGVEPSQPSP